LLFILLILSDFFNTADKKMEGYGRKTTTYLRSDGEKDMSNTAPLGVHFKDNADGFVTELGEKIINNNTTGANPGISN